MKILIITKYFSSYGGVEKLTHLICEELIKKFGNIDVLSFKKNSDKKIKLSKKINLINCKNNFVLNSAPFSIQMLKFLWSNIHKYDVVHLFVPNPWPTLIINLLNHKCKNLIISWCSDIVDQKISKKIFLPFQNRLLKNSKKIICLSKNYVKFSKDLDKFRNKIVIIPPIIKPVKLKKNYIFKKNNSIINILTVGRLVEYKGFHVLIKAGVKLPKNYKITIVGDGPLKEKLQNLINYYDLKNKISIRTNINEEDKKLFFKKADIFCFPSITRAESFGISLLEAINYSLPVIVSNNKGSGMKDMIVNNYNGYTFRNHSSNDLNKKIIKLSENPKNLIKFSKNSKKLFYKRFYDKDICKIYKQLN